MEGGGVLFVGLAVNLIQEGYYLTSGASIVGAIEVAKRKEFTNKRVIVILPDSVERYLSTGYF